jgi:predicted metalloprotease with PDZ domain
MSVHKRPKAPPHRIVLLGALLLVPVLARPAHAEIRYSVSLSDRPDHLFRVSMTVPNVHGRLTVAIPAWNALYQIRDFGGRVEDVRASAANLSLPVRPVDGQTWQIDGNGTIRIEYRVYWNDSGPFGSQLNAHHAFMNFADILFYVPGRRQEAVQVRLTGIPADWKIAVELPAGPCASCFDAASYDGLVDAPAEVGAFKEFRLIQNGAHLRVVVDAMNGASWNQDQIEGWLRKIVGYETGMMREVPFREYLFIYLIGRGAGGGGMEHANGTVIAVPDAAEIPAVTAHEFFHLWNVKRIHPQSLYPVDYARPMWTRTLWFVEGVTSTYAAYTMVRCGLWTPEQYEQHLSNLIAGLESRPARLWQSVEESSLDAWFEKYPFYNRPERSISYYNKGELDGVLLDILIRDATGNRKSLDDVLRYMNDTFAHRRRSYHGNADIEVSVEHIAGRSFADFFRNYVSGTVKIPWNDILGRAGLAVRTVPVLVANPGFQWEASANGGVKVTQVVPGGPAAKAGIEEGDLILSADGAPVPSDEQLWSGMHRPGDVVQFRLWRAGGQLSLALTLGAGRATLYQIVPLPNPSQRQRRILGGLLHGTTD